MTTLLLAFALLCPPDASVQQSVVIVRASRNGMPIGAFPVAVGSTVSIEADVFYSEFDGLGRRSYAFSGGRLVVKANNEPIFIKTNAVPLLGPPECGGAAYCRTSLDYQITNDVRSIIAEYSYESCGAGCNSSTVMCVMLLTVDPTGPITLSASPDTVTLSFWGLKPSYEIQASTNLVDWETVDTVEPEAGKVNWTAPIEGDRNFYRAKAL